MLFDCNKCFLLKLCKKKGQLNLLLLCHHQPISLLNQYQESGNSVRSRGRLVSDCLWDCEPTETEKI